MVLEEKLEMGFRIGLEKWEISFSVIREGDNEGTTQISPQLSWDVDRGSGTALKV